MDTKEKNDDLLSLKEAAQAIGVNQNYLRFLIFKKKLQGKKVGRNWTVTRSSLAEYFTFLQLEIEKELNSFKKEYEVTPKYETHAIQKHFIFPIFAGIFFGIAVLATSGGLLTHTKSISHRMLSSASVESSDIFLNIFSSGPSRILPRLSYNYASYFSDIGELFRSLFAPSVVPKIQLTEKDIIETEIKDLTEIEQSIATLRKELDYLKKNGIRVETVIKQPPNIIENILLKEIAGISPEEVDRRINIVNNNILQNISDIKELLGRETNSNRRMVQLSQNIDDLRNVTLTNITVNGVSGLTDADIPDTLNVSGYLQLAGGTLTGALTNSSTATSTFSGGFQVLALDVTSTTATSTFANGIQLTSGCFRLADGSCVGSGTVSSGVINSLAYYSAATTVNDATFLRIDPTLSLLDVNGTLGIWNTQGGAQLSLGTGNTTTGTTTLFAATSALGIGTTTPDPLSILTLGATSTNSTLLTLKTQTGQTANTFKIVNSASSTLFSIDNLGRIAGFVSNASSTVVGAFRAQDLYASSTLAIGSDALVVTAGGKIGIGTSTPSAKLTVDGNALFQNAIDSGQAFRINNNASTTLLVANTSNMIVGIGTTTFPNLSTWDVDEEFVIQNNAGSSDTMIALANDKYAYALGTRNTGKFTVEDRISAVTRLTIDRDSVGTAGIATSTPWGTFSVEMGTTNPSFVVSNNGSSTPAFYISGVNQDGFIGIGTSTPTARLHIVDDELDAAQDTLLLDQFGTLGAELIGQRARGSPTSPSAVLSNDDLLFIGGRGYGTNGYSPASRAVLILEASQNWTDSAQGTRMHFDITNDNTASRIEAMRLDQNGFLGIATTTPFALLSVEQTGTAGVPAFVVSDQANDTNFFIVTQTGSVGILTDVTPSQELHVEGDIVADLNGTATLNALCHSGTDTANETIVDCSGAPSDIAEWYETESDVEDGDIVVTTDTAITYNQVLINEENQTITSSKKGYFVEKTNDETGESWMEEMPLGPEARISVLGKSKKPYQQNIIGIVSTAPYQTFGEDVKDSSSHPKRIALSGRVPVKVSTDGGPIRAGDRLTSSSLPGVAMRATTSGVTIGIALEEFNGEQSDNATYSKSKTGKILAFVNLSYTHLSPKIAGGEVIEGAFTGIDSVYSRYYSTSTPAMVIDEKGNIGIGIGFATSSNYKLEVVGEIGAEGFINTSLRESKKEIEYLDIANEEKVLEKIANTKIALYYYEDEDGVIRPVRTGDEDITKGKRLGLLAEEVPPEILSFDGKGIDLYKMITFLFAGIKAQTLKVAELAKRILNIEERLSGLELRLQQSSITLPIAEKIEAPLSLTEKTITKTLEIEDSVTGNIYCIRISNGEWDKTMGTCNENNAITPPENTSEEVPVTEPIETNEQITATTTSPSQ